MYDEGSRVRLHPRNGLIADKYKTIQFHDLRVPLELPFPTDLETTTHIRNYDRGLHSPWISLTPLLSWAILEATRRFVLFKKTNVRIAIIDPKKISQFDSPVLRQSEHESRRIFFGVELLDRGPSTSDEDKTAMMWMNNPQEVLVHAWIPAEAVLSDVDFVEAISCARDWFFLPEKEGNIERASESQDAEDKKENDQETEDIDTEDPLTAPKAAPEDDWHTSTIQKLALASSFQSNDPARWSWYTDFALSSYLERLEEWSARAHVEASELGRVSRLFAKGLTANAWKDVEQATNPNSDRVSDETLMVERFRELDLNDKSSEGRFDSRRRSSLTHHYPDADQSATVVPEQDGGTDNRSITKQERIDNLRAVTESLAAEIASFGFDWSQDTFITNAEGERVGLATRKVVQVIMDLADEEASELTRVATSPADEEVSLVENRGGTEEREERDNGSEAIHPIQAASPKKESQSEKRASMRDDSSHGDQMKYAPGRSNWVWDCIRLSVCLFGILAAWWMHRQWISSQIPG